MPVILPVKGISPQLGDDCFVAANATIVGDVVMGRECSVWFNAVIRGDVNAIRIGDKTNIQDGAVIHCTYKKSTTIIGNNVSIGHNAIVHGCVIQDNVLVGMGAIIMDGAVIGEDSVVGAGALIVEGTIVPPKSLILGSPAKVKRSVTDKELAWIKESAENYVRYARQYMDDSAKKTGFELDRS